MAVWVDVSAVAQRWQRGGLALLTGLVLLALAWVFWGLYQQALSPSPYRVLVKSDAVVAPLQRADAARLASQAVQANLFGRYQAPVAAPVKIEQPAVVARKPPPPSVPLRLIGVFASSRDRSESAVIEVRGEQARYRVGDRLARGISLLEINTDSVLVDRRGRRETLKLPRELIPGLDLTVKP